MNLLWANATLITIKNIYFQLPAAAAAAVGYGMV